MEIVILNPVGMTYLYPMGKIIKKKRYSTLKLGSNTLCYFAKALCATLWLKNNKMKQIIQFTLALLMLSSCVNAQEISLENYVLNYDYESRTDMKIRSSELIKLLKANRAQLIDIRFEEEYKSWNMPIAISIPLPDLPNNLDKLDKKKLIVTACPHRDRAIIAMTYLKTKGYRVKYLTDGLIGMAENLRGSNAYYFIENNRQ